MKKRIVVLLLSIALIIIILAIIFMPKKMDRKKALNNVIVNITRTNDEENKLQYLIETSSINEYIPNDIIAIERESYLTGEKITYSIINCTKFLKDLLEIEWEETTEQIEDSYYYIVNINGDKNCHIKIFKKFFEEDNSSQIRGYAEVYDDNGNGQMYIVPLSLYNIVHHYTNEELNLYNSDLPVPNKDKCYEAQENIFSKVSNEDKITIQNNIRLIHSYLENIIKGQELNDSTSQEWEIETSETEITYQDLLGTQILEYYGRLQDNYKTFVSIINMLKESEGKRNLLEAANLYKEAMNEHSVLKLYNAYKIIHDYDFFVMNYPPYWNLTAGQNYPGVDAYFGSVDALN